MLSNIPELTAAVGVPRMAAIEYPFSLTSGLPGDAAGQTAILRETLLALARMTQPGSIQHLPFTFPDSAQSLNTHPSENPPIVKYVIKHPWHLPNLLRRDVPT